MFAYVHIHVLSTYRTVARQTPENRFEHLLHANGVQTFIHNQEPDSPET